MKLKLRPFGKDSSANELGYNLPLLIGWLEDIIESEQDATGRRAKLVEMAEAALALLEEVDEAAPQKEEP